MRSRVYSNPLPHVLILTAIVVGVATLALGLALVVRIREAYGSIEEDDILASDAAASRPAQHMSLATHLPALQVVVPLLAAPLTVLLRRRSAAFVVALVASWAALAIAIALWLQVAASGTISLCDRQLAAALGHRVPRRHAERLRAGPGVAVLPRWSCPIAGKHRGRSQPAAALPLLHDVRALPGRNARHRRSPATRSTSSCSWRSRRLSTYVLIALGRDRRALVASYRYLIMGTIGATFIVIGIGLAVPDDGHAQPRRHGAAHRQRAGHAAGARCAGLPHRRHRPEGWRSSRCTSGCPTRTRSAPSAVSALLAATATKVAVYVLLRFYFSVFGAMGCVRCGCRCRRSLLAAGARGHVRRVGRRLLPVRPQALVRVLERGARSATSSLGLSFNSQAGLTATIVHLFNHGLAKSAIFMLLGAVAMVMGGTSLARVQGLAKRMPLTSFGIVLCGLSLIGVPGTAGFVSKWYLILAAH